MCGDDSEEAFQERLTDELADFEKEFKSKDQACLEDEKE